MNNSVANNSSQTNFKGLYQVGSNIEQRVLWNKGIVTGAVDAGWIANANNPIERKEKARRTLSFLVLSYLTPIITLPLSNKISMKHVGKLTKNLSAQNHKAIHLSNKYLVSAEKTKEGLEILSKEYTHSPLEHLWAKIQGKKLDKAQLNFKELLDKYGGDYDLVRKKIIDAKTAVFSSDIIFTGVATGSVGFINNNLTKKETGSSGFSAEMKMADKNIVEKRAKKYEENSKKRYAAFLATVLTSATVIPFAIKKGLKAKNVSEFTKKYAPKFDYDDGMYMSRLALLFGCAGLSQAGTFLSSRNKTELKDNAIRLSTTDAIFFGGDILLASLFANISDKCFGTNLIKPSEKKTLFNKVLPNYKSLKEINEQVKAGEICKKNKPIALALWATNLAMISYSIGVLVPKLINNMIKKDVDKDNSNSIKKPIKNNIIQSKTFKQLQIHNNEKQLLCK